MNNHINSLNELLAKEELALRHANQMFAWIEDLLNPTGTETKNADRA